MFSNCFEDFPQHIHRKLIFLSLFTQTLEINPIINRNINLDRKEIKFEGFHWAIFIGHRQPNFNLKILKVIIKLNKINSLEFVRFVHLEDLEMYNLQRATKRNWIQRKSNLLNEICKYRKFIKALERINATNSWLTLLKVRYLVKDEEGQWSLILRISNIITKSISNMLCREQL